ncbi:N-6 DNA methylase [Priestia aryabhattai]|uniref:N-6 DNA methylase n=1 Tax=Priestia aryabhattai TaxID=412384 RepID=UPI0023B0FFE9|nr:N-6 DNA methylase [Priestia aryabhattai]MDE8674465.1 N-6 DNA methylase [Priestia aryabhattai]
MKSIESRAFYASSEMVNQLRNELLPQQYKNVISKIFVAKFLLKNKKHPYRLPDSMDWNKISTSIHKIGYQIDELFYKIENLNDCFSHVFGNFSLKQISDQALYNCLLISDQVSLSEEEFQDFNRVGKYFNSLIESLMLRDKKELATFITPQGLNRLMIKILNPNRGKFYDGAAGIGGTLVEAYNFSNDLAIYGQEINEENASLAYMNAIVNGVDLYKLQIKAGDTLFEPKFTDSSSQLMRFDYIAMNPPFGLKLHNMGSVHFDQYGRFNGRMGKTGKSHGDLAFLQHIIASLNETGKAALIIPTGVLLRSSIAEKAFRKYIVEMDLVETVVLLPSKIHPATVTQTVLLIFNKNKLKNRHNTIQFINAEDHYKSTRSQNYLREEDIESIVSKYEQFVDNDNDSYIIDYQNIKDNDYVLNPKQYFSNRTVKSEFGNIVINKVLYEEKISDKKPLKNIAELSRGVNLPSKSVIKEGGRKVKVIQLKDVEDGNINLTKIDQIPIQNIERYVVKQGDIIVASRGTVFKVAIVPEHEGTLVLSNMFIRIRILNKMSYMPEYIRIFIESPIGVVLLEGVQKGGAVNVLTKNDIGNVEFPDIDIGAQKEIVQIINATEQKYKELLQRAQDTLKQGRFNAYSKMGIGKVIEGLE